MVVSFVNAQLLTHDGIHRGDHGGKPWNDSYWLDYSDHWKIQSF